MVVCLLQWFSMRLSVRAFLTRGASQGLTLQNSVLVSLLPSSCCGDFRESVVCTDSEAVSMSLWEFDVDRDAEAGRIGVMAWSQQQSQQTHELASHFHLLPLIEATADAVERGAMDQHVNELVNDLASRFERCQQLLNSFNISSNPKPVTLRWQKQKLVEYENQLNERRELLAKYKLLVEEAVNSST